MGNPTSEENAFQLGTGVRGSHVFSAAAVWSEVPSLLSWEVEREKAVLIHTTNSCLCFLILKIFLVRHLFAVCS